MFCPAPAAYLMSGNATNKYTYKDSGVDIDAGTSLVEAIADYAKSTRRPGSEAELGGFGALFDLKQVAYHDPVLVAATDGVGTKLNVAAAVGKHDTIGIDLVAMCVNDLVVQGAEPLFFLDYLAMGRLDIDAAREVVMGIAEGCRQAGCALIGGESAEMPGMYAPGDYELAGFAVGAVERDRLVTGTAIEAGDVVLGLASTGLHANGFSLVRHIVRDGHHSYHAAAPFNADVPLGEAVLTPTRIYVRSCLELVHRGLARGFAHITGGGLIDNIPRVLPGTLGVRLDARAWPLPPIFRWLAEAGRIAPLELAHTFNCGIGMVAVVAPEAAEAATACLSELGETVYAVGRIEGAGPGTSRVAIEGTEDAWQS